MSFISFKEKPQRILRPFHVFRLQKPNLINSGRVQLTPHRNDRNFSYSHILPPCLRSSRPEDSHFYLKTLKLTRPDVVVFFHPYGADLKAGNCVNDHLIQYFHNALYCLFQIRFRYERNLFSSLNVNEELGVCQVTKLKLRVSELSGDLEWNKNIMLNVVTKRCEEGTRNSNFFFGHWNNYFRANSTFLFLFSSN